MPFFPEWKQVLAVFCLFVNLLLLFSMMHFCDIWIPSLTFSFSFSVFTSYRFPHVITPVQAFSYSVNIVLFKYIMELQTQTKIENLILHCQIICKCLKITNIRIQIVQKMCHLLQPSNEPSFSNFHYKILNFDLKNINFYFLERQTQKETEEKRQRKKKRKIFHLLFCSSKACGSKGWARLSQELVTPSGSPSQLAGM